MNSAIDNRLRRLREVVAGSKRPLILIYGNPDPDALASAWALRELMRSSHVPAHVVYTGEVGRPENEAMIKHLRITAGPCSLDAVNNAGCRRAGVPTICPDDQHS